MKPKQYQNAYGTVYAVREKGGVPRLMCRAKDAGKWQISGTLASLDDGTQDAEKLQAALDKAAAEKGWTLWEPNQAAPSGAAAATTGGSAAKSQRSTETATTSESGAGASTLTPGRSLLKDSSGQGCPAVSEAAPPGPSDLPAAETASLAGMAFDFSSLDTETAEKLRGITDCVLELYQSYAWGMAYQVGKAHDLLCGGDGSCETVSQLHKANGNRGENTFTAWCAYVGVERRSAYNLLNAYRLICKATPEQQKNLQLAPARLLYDAGRKDAPEQLSAAVLDGDITTHKQYRELLAQLNAEKASREKAEREREEAVAHIKAARDVQINTAHNAERIAKQRDQAQRERDEALKQARDAKAQAAEAEKSLAGARDALQAAKLRGDKLRADNAALRAQAQAAPATVEATVLDPDEVARLADEKARTLLAQWQAEQPAAQLTRPARLAALAESVVQGCAALIKSWLDEAFDATNAEEEDSIAVFNRFSYGLDMALRNGEWPTDEEIALERAGGELEGGYV